MSKWSSSINSDEIKRMIKEVLSIVEEVPDVYKLKTFEILLMAFVENKLLPRAPEAPGKVTEKPVIAPARFATPIDVRAYLQQYGIPEEKLSKLFLIEAGEVRPIYKITTEKRANAQIQLALLIALENAIKEGKFEFSMETVRQKCDDYSCYDVANFKANFNRRSELFKSLSDEEHIELTPDGKAELAEVILEILQ